MKHYRYLITCCCVAICLCCSSPQNINIESHSVNLNNNSAIAQSTPQAMPTPAETLSNDEETPEVRLQREASEFVDKILNERIANCNDMYYWAGSVSSWGNQTVKECKHKSDVDLEGEYIAPRALSEADRLNGVNAQPVEWKGHADITFETCRTSTLGSGYDGRWGQWIERLYLTINIQKAGGKWQITRVSSDNDDRLLAINCSTVNTYLKKYKQ